MTQPSNPGHEGRIVINESGESQLVPVVGAKLSDLVRKALWNGEKFNHLQFEDWLRRQPEAAQALARSHPPDRLYHLTTAKNPTHPKAPVLGVITAYPAPGVELRVLGMREDQAEIIVDPTGLADVTEEAKANRLDLGEG